MCVFVWVCTHHATPPHHSSNCSHWNWTFWKRSGLHTPFSPVLFFESVDVSTYPFSAHSPPFVPWTQVSCHFPWNPLCALTWWSACSMSTIVWRTSKPMLWSALSLLVSVIAVEASSRRARKILLFMSRPPLVRTFTDLVLELSPPTSPTTLDQVCCGIMLARDGMECSEVKG